MDRRRGQAIEIESIWCIADALVERLELLALERAVIPGLDELDVEPMLLHISDSKALV